jgi:hypothetical protein
MLYQPWYSVLSWKKMFNFNFSDLYDKIKSGQKLLMVRYHMYLSGWLWVIIFKKRVWRRLYSTSMELKCMELKTCLLLFDISKFKSIQNHFNPLNNRVNSTSIEKRNNSLNGDLFNKQKILLHSKFNTKKPIPFKLKPTPLKNWKK